MCVACMREYPAFKWLHTMFHRLYEQSEETTVIVCTCQNVSIAEFQYMSLHSILCTQRGYVFYRLDNSADRFYDFTHTITWYFYFSQPWKIRKTTVILWIFQIVVLVFQNKWKVRKLSLYVLFISAHLYIYIKSLLSEEWRCYSLYELDVIKTLPKNLNLNQLVSGLLIPLEFWFGSLLHIGLNWTCSWKFPEPTVASTLSILNFHARNKNHSY